ncbi:hypothetical protein KB20921_04660 [Edwardsiella ictaluri]|uniref:Uncharacterized protein n=1 Tax=Edwardsiella ictaluri (strain 93-146) TaxID=634503 RepID=C5BH53_EDWI9|nr:hypothetical protein NT01EI_0501 [Edwardsiella ictaluri 93-146]STP87279.1 Hexuronate transporter [Edwardsiella ictaluri]BEH97737.1 hypothetical protein KH20906_04650 [Edwardsiella ictaluri]BEI01205.1 hypothetical protein KB20921_04660 [Edwardsiella ictaluri]BEI04678.1 hypothetical protein KH201010_04640 [Edwardsiella ictaluri]
MIGMVTIGVVLGYLTRNAIAAPAWKTPCVSQSNIIATYSACDTIMQPVAGYMLDPLGTQIDYAVFTVIWT